MAIDVRTLSKRLHEHTAALNARIDTLQAQVDALAQVAKAKTEETTEAPQEATSDGFRLDLMIGVLEALHSAKINTSARMAEELEAKWLGDDAGDFMLKRFPWLKDYR